MCVLAMFAAVVVSDGGKLSKRSKDLHRAMRTLR